MEKELPAPWNSWSEIYIHLFKSAGKNRLPKVTSHTVVGKYLEQRRTQLDHVFAGVIGEILTEAQDILQSNSPTALKLILSEYLTALEGGKVTERVQSILSTSEAGESFDREEEAETVKSFVNWLEELETLQGWLARAPFSGFNHQQITPAAFEKTFKLFGPESEKQLQQLQDLAVGTQRQSDGVFLLCTNAWRMNFFLKQFPNGSY